NDFDNEKKQNDNHVNHEISNSATNESASKILGNDSVSRVSLILNRITHLCDIALDNVNNRILDICNRAAHLLEHFRSPHVFVFTMLFWCTTYVNHTMAHARLQRIATDHIKCVPLHIVTLTITVSRETRFLFLSL